MADTIDKIDETESMSVLDILDMTRKDNCGRCGFPACMAFAAAVYTRRAALDLCPYIHADSSTDGVDLRGKDSGAEEEGSCSQQPMLDPDTALALELREKIADLDLSELAPGLGGECIKHSGERVMKLRYLGQDVMVSPKGVFSRRGSELEPRDQILLYNYIFFRGGKGLSGQWAGLESFPNSMSKVVTLKKYTEDRIATDFTGDSEGLEAGCRTLDGVKADGCHADLCMQVPVLPKVPLQIHFWDHDPDDGFSAEVKVLFDQNALSILDIESLIFASERLAETLAEIRKNRGQAK